MEMRNGSGPGATILVADDEPVIVNLLERILTRDGHTVVTASCGADALEQAREHAPELILMDISMPDMDGYEATSRIKSLPGMGQTRVIFLTGKSPDEDGGRSFAVGGAAFLCKPFKDHQIRDIVMLALRSSAEVR